MSSVSRKDASATPTENGAKAGAPKTCDNQGFINYGKEEQMEVFGYVQSTFRNILLWIGIILTVGLLRLFLHWFPHWRLYISHLRCSLDHANVLLFVENYQGKYKSFYVEKVKMLSATESSHTGWKKSYDNKAMSNTELLPVKMTPIPGVLTNFRLHLDNDTYRDAEMVRGVWVKKLCYIWDVESRTFMQLAGLEQGFQSADYHSCTGLSRDEQELRRMVYGLNEIIVPVQTILNMIAMELLDPFYIFQLFSICLWFSELYIFYPITIIIMTTFGVASYVVQTRKSQRRLYETVHATGVVTLCRQDGSTELVSFNELVPGDVIEIPNQGCRMSCDAMLLSGHCIVNESMLTGESVPVGKSAFPRYNEKTQSPYTLFCGTEVIQARSQNQQPVRAVVLRTGYLTTKGNLVRSILYPPPADFQFEKDSYKFILILAVVAMAGLIYTVIDKGSRDTPVGELIVKALDLLTICIPPALPAAMTVGKIFAQKRLEKRDIYCINSRIINVTGGVDCMCFDKTGTLTEDGLDYYCALPVTNASFESEIYKPTHASKEAPILRGMAVAHSLTIINDKISGDPLDLKMFESTGWVLEEPTPDAPSKFGAQVMTVVKEGVFKDHAGNEVDGGAEIALFHQFAFESNLQRMSVVTRESGDDCYVLYCKGSPETLQSLSKRETVPTDITASLHAYTEKGYRVIAVGRRRMTQTNYADIQMLSREECEQDLEFLGLIVLENRVKPQTPEVIEVLRKAEIKTVMITGDNMETALSVARESGIIGFHEQIIHVTALIGEDNIPTKIVYTPQIVPKSPIEPEFVKEKHDWHVNVGCRFAMTGTTWQIVRVHFPQLLSRLIVRGVVFARMNSNQKQQLVQMLKETDYHVGMCGDGANDCGALKTAHVGISLSDAESSVASPFTAKDSNILCVPLVIKEGRAALMTAFGIFKFMILYSLVEFLSVFILYTIDSNLTDFQFLFIDIFLVLQFAISFGLTEAYTGDLVKQTPGIRLLTVVPLTSIISQIAIMAGFLIGSYYTVQLYYWYVPFVYLDDYVYSCVENYAVYGASMGQYLIMVIVFSQGFPYRQPIYTNKLLTGSLIVMGVIITYMALFAPPWLANLMELEMPPTYHFRVVIVCFWLLNLIVSYSVEDFFVGYLLEKKILPKLRRAKSLKKYLIIEKEIQSDYDWPNMTKAESQLSKYT